MRQAFTLTYARPTGSTCLRVVFALSRMSHVNVGRVADASRFIRDSASRPGLRWFEISQTERGLIWLSPEPALNQA